MPLDIMLISIVLMLTSVLFNNIVTYQQEPKVGPGKPFFAFIAGKL